MNADTNVPADAAIMKAMPERNATRPRLWTIASAAAAIALAVYIAPLFMYLNVIWNPGHYGEFGMTLAENSNSVADVVPGSPADNAGIRPGDRVDRPQTLRARLLLGSSYTFPIAPRPGERMTVSTFRGARGTTVALQARPLAPLSEIDKTLLLLKCLWLLIFVAVAFALVLLCPSKMTWAFYAFALNLVLIFWSGNLPSIPSNLPAGWLLAYEIAAGFIAPAGLAGFLVFCARFPTNASTGWRRVVENLAPFLAAAFVPYFMYVVAESVRFQFRWPWLAFDYVTNVFVLATYAVGIALLVRIYLGARGPERQQTKWILLALISAGIVFFAADIKLNLPVISIFVLGAAVVLINYFGARGLERHRIGWVFFGFLCALAASAADFLLGGISLHPAWYVRALELLYVVLPLTVAYAVIRHRVIDVRFVASRALVLGVIASIVAGIVIGIDWLFSTRLPASRLQAATYVGLALVVGFSLNATWRSVGKTIDFVFFRPWYRAREQVEIIAEATRHATSNLDLYEPLTAGIAKAFSLTSAALFERLEDGGFFRVAALGWPPGTTWHILPNDQLAMCVGKSQRIVDVDAFGWQKRNLPGGVARPMIVLPIVTSRQVAAMLFYGAHENGTALDPDERRAIRRLCADAGLIYARSRLESGRTAFLTEPLGV